MVNALTRNVVWAEFDVFESLARGFRPENKALSMGDLLIVLLFVAAVLAAAWAASTESSLPAMIAPDCAPLSRSRRVSLRVSMSAIATTPRANR